MTIIHFKSDEFFEYLKKKGCKEYRCDDETLDGKYVVYLAPNSELVPIQILSVYWPIHVRKICESCGISMPKKFKKHFNQLKKLKKNK